MLLTLTKRIPESAFLLSARVVTFGCAAGILAAASRSFDKENFGIWALATSVTSIVTSFDLGIANAIRNHLAIETPADGQEEFAAGFWFLCLLGGFYLAVLLFIFSFGGFRSFFSTPDPELKARGGIILLTSIALLLPRLPFYLGMNAFFSFREARLNAAFDTMSWVAMLFTTIIGASLSWPILPMVIIYQLANIGGNGLGLWVFLRRRGWGLKLRNFGSRLRKLQKRAGPFALQQFVGMAMNYMSTFVVGAAVSVSEVGPFRATQTIFLAIITLQITALMPLWSEFSFAISRNEDRAISRLLRSGAIKSGLFIIPTLLFAFLSPLIVRLWLGISATSMSLTWLLAGWTIMTGAANLLSVMLNGVGRATLSLLGILPGAVMVVPLALFLGRHFGAEGVAGGFFAMSSLNVLLLSLAVAAWFRRRPARARH